MDSILKSLAKIDKLIALYEDKKEANWFAGNIEETTLSNDLYRNVLFTGTNLQLVVMSIEPGEEIGLETHESGDQFIRIEAGTGEFVIDGKTQSASDGDSVLIPAGVEHNVINTGDEPLKLYALYSPPEHKPDTQQKDKPEEISEAWSKKYKDSINCSNPKGFSQKAHCAGKKKKKNSTNESQNLTETFNSPYPVEVVKLDKKFGVPRYQANVKLPDNSDMKIIFMKVPQHHNVEMPGHNQWEVEFTRDGSLGITGEGDAFRVFATAIEAIRQFIKLEKPSSLIFSATKDLDNDDVGNEESRAKLYKRMVTRFANTVGYDVDIDDYADWEQYELKRKNIKKTESSIMRGIQYETKGTPYPGTYEQEYGRFKKKGQRRTTNMTD